MNLSPYTFAEITVHKIPELLKILDNSRLTPWNYKSHFSDSKSKSVSNLSNQGENGFSGCYVFFNTEGKAIYTGISRNLPARVWNHYNGKNHHQSSFIYKVARQYPEISKMADWLTQFDNKSFKRPKDFHKSRPYLSAFDKARKAIQQWSVAHVRIDDPVTLYLFEVAASMHYQSELNCFRTH